MTQWYCYIAGQQSGPVSGEQLRSMAQQGPLQPKDMVCVVGAIQWTPAGSVQGLFTDGDGAGTVPGSAAVPTPPAPPVSRDLTPHRGVAVLVLGILALPMCFILGIIAWVMGNNDLEEMAKGRMDPAGKAMTQAGRICGKIATIIAIVIAGFYLLIAAIMVIATLRLR